MRRATGRSSRIWTGVFLVGLGLGSGSTSATANPEVDYALHCMGCHQQDGAGTEGKVPALKGSMGSFLSVSGGREFLVQVPGTAQSALSDARIAAVLNWMLYQFSPEQIPADFVPYTTTEISRLRVPLASVTPVRDALVAAINARSDD